MTALTRDQVREVDRLAIQELGIPGMVLMENAASNAATAVLDTLHNRHSVDPTAARVAILCGGGNNGGDGYAIARHLHNHGVAVTVLAMADPAKLTGDAAVNHTICKNMKLPIHPATTLDQFDTHTDMLVNAHIIVDALLGTGFIGQVREPMAEMINYCNALFGPAVVAVDVPSGLDCDTGQPSNATMRADVTVTFVANKRGFTLDTAQPWVGRVVVADIGAPPELIERVLNKKT